MTRTERDHREPSAPDPVANTATRDERQPAEDRGPGGQGPGGQGPGGRGPGADPDHPDAPDRLGERHPVAPAAPAAPEDGPGAGAPRAPAAAAPGTVTGSDTVAASGAVVEREPVAEPEAVVGPETVVEVLCRGAEQLLRLAGPRARRVRVCSGDATVQVEWHAPPGSGGSPRRGGRGDGPAGPESEAGHGLADEGPPTVDAGGREQPAGASSGAEDAPLLVCAPCVGTFYHAPQPGAAPFVEPGDLVAAGDQVGLVEAMKLMTPVEAETPGRVVRVLVADGTPVEFGQPLVGMEPSPPPAGG